MDRGRVEREVLDSSGTTVGGAAVGGVGDFGVAALVVADFAAGVFEVVGFAATVFEVTGFAVVGFATSFATGFATGFATVLRGMGVRGVGVRGVVVRGVGVPDSPEVVRGAAGRRTRGDASAGFPGASETSPGVGAADAPAGFSSGSESTSQPYQRRLGCLWENRAFHHEFGT